MSNSISSFPKHNIPLKEDLPCLQYDLARFCHTLRETIKLPLPTWLSNYTEHLNLYADNVELLKPSAFPPFYRVYIIDYRLNILFVALDKTGKMSTFISKYSATTNHTENYYYGTGKNLGNANSAADNYDYKTLRIFNDKYEFLPIEEMAMSTALIFNGDILEDKRLLSNFQTTLILEQFRSKNLIDWKSIFEQTKNGIPFYQSLL